MDGLISMEFLLLFDMALIKMYNVFVAKDRWKEAEISQKLEAASEKIAWAKSTPESGVLYSTYI